MTDRRQIELLASELRRQEISRIAHQFASWISTQLRTRHEAALRRPAGDTSLQPANPTPV